MLRTVGLANVLGLHSTATDHGELMTPVAGKRWSLLMAGDDDEVYDKKPQRHTKDNRTSLSNSTKRLCSRYYNVEANY